MTMTTTSTYASSLFSLHGRVVLVTGASSGLGRHWAHLLSTKCGARVVAGARTRSKLDSLVAECRSEGGECVAVVLDATKADSCRAMVRTAVERYGAVDCLINNAGTSFDETPSEEHTEEEWHRVMDLNTKGCWLMAQACHPVMKGQASGGAIVNVSSIFGLSSCPGSWSTARARRRSCR